ncbi:MAG TPA: PilZ domain-containing protein [Vicinamibacteria bacterium]|jgi:hypothetical protein|nr:PilZ domain-containing protein [Vicinamibacteria bacterium]
MTNGAVSSGGNRRITARKACRLTVRYKSKSEWHPATAMDLSPNGCRLRVGEDLPRETHLSVLFEAPLRDGARALSVEVPGVVTWSRHEGLSYQAGVHFDVAPVELEEVLAALA